jgi:hypothetical protein
MKGTFICADDLTALLSIAGTGFLLSLSGNRTGL